MRTIIAGSRTIENYKLLCFLVKKSSFEITEIISGGARGIDELAERYAKENKIPLKIFPANWSKYGKGAGPIRNTQMAENADALIAIWDGKSTGTKNMIDAANKNKLKVFVENLQELTSDATTSIPEM